MEWVVERDGRALQRIVALLLALADVADRAVSIPLPGRVIVLAILRHAEIAAWAFVFGAAADPAARGQDCRHHHMILPGAPVAGDHAAGEAARLSLSLRVMALIIANGAFRALASPTMPTFLHRSVAPKRARHPGSWRVAAPLPPPDTS